MWANCIDHPSFTEAEKRVCASLCSKRTFADSATFQLVSQDVDLAKIWTLPTNFLPLFKGGIIRKGATQLHNFQNRAFHKITRTCIVHVDSDYIV